jgi:hypothetical protein
VGYEVARTVVVGDAVVHELCAGACQCVPVRAGECR